MSDKIVIIFIHKGNPPYLKHALDLAKRNNPEIEVILLGDESNKNHHNISHYFIDDLFGDATLFEKDDYKHMSKNPYWFELICYQRWFVLNEFLKDKDYDYVCYLDSDALLFSNLKTILKKLPDNKYDLIGNACVVESFNPSFNIFSLRFISKMCDYIKESYHQKEVLTILEQKWDKHLNENLIGGICDMTQIGLFVKSCVNTNFKLLDLYKLDNILGVIPDGNINLRTINWEHDKSLKPTAFKMAQGFKELGIKDYEAYITDENNITHSLISSHFLGGAKQYMQFYTAGNVNPKTLSFKTKIFLKKLKLTLRNRLQKIYLVKK